MTIPEKIDIPRTRIISALDYASISREHSIEIVDALIRSVVEECCKVAQGELQFWHTESGASVSMENALNRHFAWLKKRE